MSILQYSHVLFTFVTVYHNLICCFYCLCYVSTLRAIQKHICMWSIYTDGTMPLEELGLVGFSLLIANCSLLSSVTLAFKRLGKKYRKKTRDSKDFG